MLLLLLRSLFAASYFRSVSVSVSGTLLITLTLPIERKVGEEEAVAVESSCIMHAHTFDGEGGVRLWWSIL